MSLPRQRQVAVAICCLVYAVSFFLPAGDNHNTPAILGWEAFLNALLLSWFLPMWWANPGFFLAGWWVLKGKPNWAMLATVVAALLALSQSIFLPPDSSTGYGYRLLIGYYVWLGSIVLLGLFSALFAAREAWSARGYRSAPTHSNVATPA
ncbi:hypothetical protein [Blastopirellula marina]|uniref:Transmembrane protein n=1 Tax=Blastopirellula marina TaxID=124 RepID=A0A2S8GUV9_9BACT|nr:hypothetical protein [Blastopirellula marina]PQO48196.1 hypothetical protein C5Y93_00495 [Blastopirellula marina]